MTAENLTTRRRIFWLAQRHMQAALEAAMALEKLALNTNDNMLEFVQHEGPAAINKLVEKLPAVRAATKQPGKPSPLVIAPHTPRTDLESKRAQSESPNLTV